MNKAFTLVELAIVLVIIGLITGGVLGAQSLVESSKLQSVIKDISKYQTAVKAFQLEYNALPGDFSEAEDYWGSVSGSCASTSGTGTQTCNGDGDKTFDYYAGSNNEPWRTWQHLSNAEILEGSYTGISNNSLCSSGNYCTDPGNNAPESAISGASWSLIYVLASYNWVGKNRSRNILALGNPQNATSGAEYGIWRGLALTSRQMKKIDDKIDDGLAGSGVATNMNTNGTAVGGYNPDCTTLSGTDLIYKVSYSDVACNLFIDID